MTELEIDARLKALDVSDEEQQAILEADVEPFPNTEKATKLLEAHAQERRTLEFEKANARANLARPARLESPPHPSSRTTLRRPPLPEDEGAEVGQEPVAPFNAGHGPSARAHATAQLDIAPPGGEKAREALVHLPERGI